MRDKFLEPLVILISEMTAEVLSNLQTLLSANPEETLKKLRSDLNAEINKLKSSGNKEAISILGKHISRIQAMGGFEKIVPIEGIIFKYGGNSYKATGVFAPVNQILGLIKYGRVK